MWQVRAEGPLGEVVVFGVRASSRNEAAMLADERTPMGYIKVSVLEIPPPCETHRLRHACTGR